VNNIADPPGLLSHWLSDQTIVIIVTRHS